MRQVFRHWQPSTWPGVHDTQSPPDQGRSFVGNDIPNKPDPSTVKGSPVQDST